jgi:hypothetical protein
MKAEYVRRFGSSVQNTILSFVSRLRKTMQTFEWAIVAHRILDCYRCFNLLDSEKCCCVVWIPWQPCCHFAWNKYIAGSKATSLQMCVIGLQGKVTHFILFFSVPKAAALLCTKLVSNRRVYVGPHLKYFWTWWITDYSKIDYPTCSVIMFSVR